MRIAVLGTGFGAYHVELYMKMTDVEKIIVWKPENINSERKLELVFFVKECYSNEESKRKRGSKYDILCK